VYKNTHDGKPAFRCLSDQTVMGVGKSAFAAVGQFTGKCLTMYVCSFPSFIPFLPDFSACHTVIVRTLWGYGKKIMIFIVIRHFVS
jgi:hypothetical protein